MDVIKTYYVFTSYDELFACEDKELTLDSEFDTGMPWPVCDYSMEGDPKMYYSSKIEILEDYEGRVKSEEELRNLRSVEMLKAKKREKVRNIKRMLRAIRLKYCTKKDHLPSMIYHRGLLHLLSAYGLRELNMVVCLGLFVQSFITSLVLMHV